METTSSTGHKSPGTTTESTAGGITVDRDYLAEALGIELPTDVQRLGVDGAGEVHYYSPRTARVWVVDANDDAVTHEADLAGKRVHEWLDHVREERGSWHACNYDRSLGEGLANALERAAEGQ